MHALPRCEPDRSIAKRALAVNPPMHWIAECAPIAAHPGCRITALPARQCVRRESRVVAHTAMH
ncbi:hypothetical protein A8H40_04995 [Burkholderia multivorans]|uniref:Uncharacterized protein n=2 Tax=Burkholderia multivorans TaxID=87883 RepID=B9BH84_9BURK|nr:hypothetical protein A8H40_04995 [Burkholderia multivorans]EEE08974.1 hypothetical protein BURMUCGD2_4346 [Burkholderia multivorans CGD2]EEE14893.1 hypothetical protein BURMUCGD2M_4335 [Burkholderia multivorans CGD2M]PRD85957.1 hypothetical protein C6P76_16375 [Burkholderia multivorans]PRE27127.1 hypothetical protein C6P79_16585 [Burkholderia multivorans]